MIDGQTVHLVAIHIAKGQIGVYLFQVMDSDAGAYYTEDDVNLRTSQEAQYRQQFLSSVLAEEADMKDNRARFY